MSGEDFLSGTSGEVSGNRRTASAAIADGLTDALSSLLLQNRRLRRAAGAGPPRRRVLAMGIERDDGPNLMAAARAELERSRHEVRFAAGAAGSRGKFENLNALLTTTPALGFDWLLMIDDDVALPRGFLDAFLFLAERYDLSLAQPAHRARSHAAWRVTRRRPASVVRETLLVEIGPVTALRANTFAELLPFPELRSGWGLDLHWSAVAREHRWRMGVIDATPMLHAIRPIATAYDRSEAIAEARAFLARRPYTPAAQAQRTLTTHRNW